MPRPFTIQEQAHAHLLCPNMNVTSVVVTDNATHRYNCLAWTLGITTSWIWPWSSGSVTKLEFDTFYQAHGYSPASFGPIAVFGLSTHEMTHGTISGPKHGPRWESKCGVWLRIQHGLAEMEGGPVYGNVIGFYTAFNSSEADMPKIVEKGQSMKSQKLSRSDTKFLHERIEQIEPGLRERFERSYNAWRETWNHPLIAVSSNPLDRTRTPTFLELIALGPDVVPLLMEKLTHAEEFFALQASDRLLKPELIVRWESNDPAVLMGEQHRAFETVKRWIRRVA